MASFLEIAQPVVNLLQNVISAVVEFVKDIGEIGNPPALP